MDSNNFSQNYEKLQNLIDKKIIYKTRAPKWVTNKDALIDSLYDNKCRSKLLSEFLQDCDIEIYEEHEDIYLSFIFRLVEDFSLLSEESGENPDEDYKQILISETKARNRLNKMASRVVHDDLMCIVGCGFIRDLYDDEMCSVHKVDKEVLKVLYTKEKHLSDIKNKYDYQYSKLAYFIENPIPQSIEI